MIFRYIKLVALSNGAIKVQELPRSTMNSPDRDFAREELQAFSYLDLVEMHDDLEKLVQVMHGRLHTLQEEIKYRIEERLTRK